MTEPRTAIEPYVYTNVEVLNVVDGDTVDLRLTRDIGFYTSASVAVRFRLVVVDTPERGEPLHDEAWEFTRAWLQERAGDLTAETQKHNAASGVPDGGFGRWLVDIWCSSTGECLTDALLDAGLAHIYKRGS